MPITYKQFKANLANNAQSEHPVFSEADVSQIQDFVQSLNAINANVIGTLGNANNQAVVDMRRISTTISDLLLRAQDAEIEQLERGRVSSNDINTDSGNIISNEDEISTSSNNINNDNVINTSSNLIDNGADNSEAEKEWDRTAGALNHDLDAFLLVNLNEMLAIGALDESAPNKVDMNVFFTGLETLNRVFGITIDQERYKKSYDDHQKYMRPHTVMPSFEDDYDETHPDYEKDEDLSEKYFENVNDIFKI